MENREQEITLDIRDIIRIIRKRFWIITAFSLCAALISGIASVYYLKPVYESGVSVVIGKTYDKTQNNNYDYNDIMMYQSLLKTYAVIADSKTVANKANGILSRSYNINPSVGFALIYIFNKLQN